MIRRIRKHRVATRIFFSVPVMFVLLAGNLKGMMPWSQESNPVSEIIFSRIFYPAAQDPRGSDLVVVGAAGKESSMDNRSLFQRESRPQISSGSSSHVDTMANDSSLRRTRDAYFVLLAGVNPTHSAPLSDPQSFLGYLLHLAVVSYVLRSFGSTMDIVILIRLDHTVAGGLTKAQTLFLEKLQIKVEYIPQNQDETVQSFMMDKFHVLRYHQYKRIIFLDADVLPLCNLDHYFDMSERGIFAPNFVFAYRNEPSQGGFFMLSPEPNDWDLFRRIPTFINETVGFGRPLQSPAEGTRGNYTLWDWYGANTDQGMLYHWVVFVKKNVTFVNKNRVRKYDGTDEAGNFKLVDEIQNFSLTCPNLLDVQRQPQISFNPVYTDMFHFSGFKKPWINSKWTVLSVMNVTWKDTRDPSLVWSLALRDAWRAYKLGSLRHLMRNSEQDKDFPLLESYLMS